MHLLALAGNAVQQTLLAPLVGYGGTAKPPGAPYPDPPATSPSNPANLANALALDAAFWRDNHDRLTARFDDWVSH
jgi:putative spermidine/putrescine transport system substrate-binding protein